MTIYDELTQQQSLSTHLKHIITMLGTDLPDSEDKTVIIDKLSAFKDEARRKADSILKAEGFDDV